MCYQARVFDEGIKTALLVIKELEPVQYRHLVALIKEMARVQQIMNGPHATK